MLPIDVLLQTRTESEQAKATRRLLKRQRERKLKLEKSGIKYDFDGAAYVSWLVSTLFPY